MIHGSQRRRTPSYFRNRYKRTKNEITRKKILEIAEYELYADDYIELLNFILLYKS
jgi:hypothetical protein